MAANINHRGFNRRLNHVRKVFGQFQADILDIVPVAYNENFPFPFNNFLYKVTLQHPMDAFRAGEPGTTTAPIDETSFVIRLSNLKADGLNNENRIQNEVACSMLAQQALVDAGFGTLVPRIYAWAAPKALHSDNEEDYGWVISEYRPGSDLDKCFPTLSAEKQKDVLTEMAAILYVLQNTNLSPSITKVGGISFDKDGSLVSGKTALTIDIPRATYVDSWETRLRQRLANATEYSTTGAWVDHNISQRIETFISTGALRKLLSGMGTSLCLIHGDFTMNNILYDVKEGRITGLLDFDFARISHPVEEYQMGLYDIGHSMLDHPKGIWSSIATNDFSQQPSGLSENDTTLWNLARQWNTIAREKAVFVPGDVDEIGRFKTLNMLSDALGACEGGNSTQELLNDETTQKRREAVNRVVGLMKDLGM